MADKPPILLVDDSLDTCEAMRMLLEMDGCAVSVFHSGKEAIDAVRDGMRPGIALLDIGLPDMSGFELAGTLRRTADLSRCAFIALTGWSADALEEDLHGADFSLHLTKPVDFARLSELIRTLQG